MQDRLSRVAAAIVAAATRRREDLNTDRAAALGAICAALETEYGPLEHLAPVQPTDGTDRLAAVASVFGLSPVEIDLLAIAAASDLDPNIGLGYDLLTGQTGTYRATVALALELCEIATAAPDGFALLGGSAPPTDRRRCRRGMALPTGRRS
jgi:hypothetical protein